MRARVTFDSMCCCGTLPLLVPACALARSWSSNSRRPTHVGAQTGWGSEEPRRLAAWLQDVPKERWNIYVHAREPDSVKHPLFERNLVRAVKTKWGTVSLVKAHITLIKQALRNEATGGSSCCRTVASL